MEGREGDEVEEDAEGGILSTPPPRVGGCLGLRWRRWKALGAEKWTVSTLRFGYRLPFAQFPPLSPRPLEFPTYVGDPQRAGALREEVERMMEKGALEVVSNPPPGFYSRLFLVQKASGGWRPVIDLSPLNGFITQTRFQMETMATVLSSIRKGDFMASIDLSDAYFQVPVHEESRKFLRFTLGGKVFQFRVLCFGLATAPQVFTRVFTLVSSWAHARGIRLLRYLDDWLILASSAEELTSKVNQVLLLCHDLGIVINKEKSDLEPKQQVKYLGMWIDSQVVRAFPTEARIDNLRMVVRSFLSSPSPRAKEWQVLLGHLSSLEKLVPHGRLRMRPLQLELRSKWSRSDSHDRRVPWTPQIARDLDWWTDDRNLRQGVPLEASPPEMLLFTDASLEGWGAHLHELTASGRWSPQEAKLHINLLEMKAVLMALHAFQDRLLGHTVGLMSDNTTVVAYVNKQGGTVSSSLFLLTREVLMWAETHSVSLVARYIPGSRNVVADQLSRRGQVIGTEWSLHPLVTKEAFRLWGAPVVDLFASALNKKLPVYCSLLPDPLALQEDAFLMQWDDLDVYAFPPFNLIRRVLNRVLNAQRLRMTLVAPCWPQKEWFPDLLSLLVDLPRSLPTWDKLLRQPRSNRFHLNVKSLNLHAWRLSSSSSDREAFRRGLRQRCPQRSDFLPQESMNASGRLSQVGAVEGISILSMPLFRI